MIVEDYMILMVSNQRIWRIWLGDMSSLDIWYYISNFTTCIPKDCMIDWLFVNLIMAFFSERRLHILTFRVKLLVDMCLLELFFRSCREFTSSRRNITKFKNYFFSQKIPWPSVPFSRRFIIVYCADIKCYGTLLLKAERLSQVWCDRGQSETRTWIPQSRMGCFNHRRKLYK